MLARESGKEPRDHWQEAMDLYGNAFETEVLPRPKPMRQVEVKALARRILAVRHEMGGANSEEAFDYYRRKFEQRGLEEDVAAIRETLPLSR